MKRRDFLKVTGAGLATTLTGLGGSARPAPAGRNLRKGFMLGTFKTEPRRELSLAEQFRMLKEAGFEGVEPSGGLDRDEVLSARDATGLAIPSVVVATHWRRPHSDPDPAVRAEGLEGLKTALHDAKAYGAPSVLLVPAVVNERVAYDEAYTRSQAEIRKAIPLAQELGVKIAIENVWNHFLLSPIEATRYVDEFESPAVAWHFDAGNIINYGWPEHWIRILGKRIVQLHVKEFSRKKRDDEGLWRGFDVNYLEGDNDWPAIMKALDEVEYSGWGIAEPPYRPPDLDDMAWLRDIAERMDRIFAM